MRDWSVNIAGINFKNPIIAAAGGPTINVESMTRCIDAGMGAVTTKSISFIPFTWKMPRPANFFLDKYGDPGSMTTIELGFWKPDDGEEFVRQIKPAADKANVRVIANINLEGYEAGPLEKLVKKLQDAGADMIETACPCPIVTPIETAGRWYEDNLETVTRILGKAVKIPFYTKCPTDFLTPQNIRIIEDSGAAAIHFTPPPYGITVDIETAKPLLPAYGLYYNKGWRGVGSYFTYLLSTMTKLPIICSGGVATGREAIERLMLGASLVGICTIIMYKGYAAAAEMVKDFNQFMDNKQYSSVEEIIGIASPYVGDLGKFTDIILQGQLPKEAAATVVEPQKCTGCGKCTVCTYGAAAIRDKKCVIDQAICEKCGVCVSICPKNALSIVNQ